MKSQPKAPKSVEMYDLFENGNYRGSFRTKMETKKEAIRLMASSRTSSRRSPPRLTALRSIHFDFG